MRMSLDLFILVALEITSSMFNWSTNRLKVCSLYVGIFFCLSMASCSSLLLSIAI